MNEIIIKPCNGYNSDLNDLAEIGRLLLKMGYTVRRGKIRKGSGKALVSVLIVKDEQGGNKNDQ